MEVRQRWRNGGEKKQGWTESIKYNIASFSAVGCLHHRPQYGDIILMLAVYEPDYRIGGRVRAQTSVRCTLGTGL